MGMWGKAAWQNDGAADWFGDLFQASKLATRVEKTLKKKDVEEWREEFEGDEEFAALIDADLAVLRSRLRPAEEAAPEEE